eukprot:854855_1
MGACLASRPIPDDDEQNALNEELIKSNEDNANAKIQMKSNEDNSSNESASIRETEGRDHIFMKERIDMDEKDFRLCDMDHSNDLEMSEHSASSSVDLSKFKHNKQRKLLSDSTLVEWMQSSPDKHFIVIDVRDTNMDYSGGHIKGGINIEHIDFIKKIKGIVETYHTIPNIVFYCMYSKCRSPMCCDWYCMAVTALLNKYDNGNKPLPSLMKICSHESADFKDLYQVEMNEDMYRNLCQQNVYVLDVGFAHFLNKYNNDADLVVDFDTNMWMKQPYSEDKLIHRNDW